MKFYLSILFALILGLLACEPEEEKIVFDPNVSLRFSTDTIIFDTVFTSRQSITNRLRVFNDNENAVNIERIALAEGTGSPYKVYVNGRADAEFDNTTLFGGDSLLILVEVTIDPMDENLPFIVTDELQFTTNNNQQNVKLVAWGQDAIFYNGEILACNTTWTNDRPYVIFNSVLVDSLCNLTIEAGARVYSHRGSFILVEGTIDVQGTAEEKVIFRNDRFEETFENAPGQWGGFVFLPGSKDNMINYADIRNAEFGAYLGTPDEDEDYDLTIANTRIENMGGNETFTGNIINVQPGYGILAISSDLYVYNTLVNNCAINVVGNYAGGNYRYEHCTFANYSFDFFRDAPAMVISDNLQLSDNSLLVGDLTASMENCIVWGSMSDELLVSNSGESQFELTIASNLLRLSADIVDAENNIVNEDPKFTDPFEYNYALDTLSPAKDVGVDLGIATDLEGKLRDTQPDLGALERIEN